MSETTASAKAKSKAANANKTGKSAAKPKSQASSAAAAAAQPALNLEELRELAELINEHGFTDFEFENENIRVRLSKNAATAAALPPLAAQAPAYFAAPSSSVSASPSSSTAMSAPEAPPATDEDLYKIVSPIVGTFYRSPSPDKDPYIKEGDKVSENTIVCIVEAMKLMNEIQAETTGEVVKIYVENGQPVEYGQPLFGIRK